MTSRDKKPLNGADIVHFWFEESVPENWFKKDPEFDAMLTERFGQLVERALAGQLDDWAAEAETCLGLILLLDQMTRNIYRDTPRAFAGDELALALSLKMVDKGWLDKDNGAKRQFALMPMMHSEDLAIQDASLPLFKTHTMDMVYDYAVRHRDIVARFGRFPHRNHILGRPSSDSETAFLTKPGSSF